MAYEIAKLDVWSGSIKDQPGALAEKLSSLSEAGAQLGFVFARRDKPGTGVVFLSPLKGAAQTRAAKAAGLAKSGTLQALRLEGADKPGLCAKVTRAIADAGVNLRGISAAAIGRRCALFLAFDNAKDAGKARRAVSKALSGK